MVGEWEGGGVRGSVEGVGGGDHTEKKTIPDGSP